MATPPPPRFLTLDQVAEHLNISASQAYALVRSGDLPALKVGGRGQWRVDRTRLEDWVALQHDLTAGSRCCGVPLRGAY